MKQLNVDNYGASEHGNFAVIDTIPVPHPYMVTARHVGHASDRFSGMLGQAAVESAERDGIYCGICKGKLKFKEHETALLVSCKAPLVSDDGQTCNEELHAYLLKVKPQCEADGYVGFAFKDDSK